ncbi:MAG TPA: ABC transporter permease, partial [Caldilineae bacterium]|nr:ABC transporter permease [Caldilineae bacterium]
MKVESPLSRRSFTRHGAADDPSLHLRRWATPRELPRRDRGIIGAMALLLLICAATLAAPWLAPADPAAVHLDEVLLPPGSRHWAGTDMFGRDVWSRVLHGGRLTLGIALLAAIVAVLPGVLLGLISGYLGGLLDEWISRVTDAILAIPYLLLAMLIVAVAGPGLGA